MYSALSASCSGGFFKRYLFYSWWFYSLYLVAIFNLISCHSSTLTLCSSPMKLPTSPEYSVPLHIGVSLVVQTVKNLPAMQETWLWSPSWKDPLEKGMATHSSILAWRIPLTEEPCGLQKWLNTFFFGSLPAVNPLFKALPPTLPFKKIPVYPSEYNSNATLFATFLITHPLRPQFLTLPLGLYGSH